MGAGVHSTRQAIGDCRLSVAGKSVDPPSSDQAGFPSGDGAMAMLIRATDWSKTPLGPIETWPENLRAVVGICANRAAEHEQARAAASTLPGRLSEAPAPARPRVMLIDSDIEQLAASARRLEAAGFIVEPAAMAGDVAPRDQIADDEDRQIEQKLAFALQAGRMGSWELDVVSQAIIASDSCRTVFGVRPGDPFDHNDHIIALVHPDDRRPRQKAINHAVAAGADVEVEFRVVRPDGEIGWVLTRGQAIYENGQAVRFAGVCLDITARKAAEEHQRLLLNELNHRVKNTLATVQSLALQTRQTVADPAMFDDTFLARIYALAGAHELLTEASWESASLAEVIHRTLRLHMPAGQGERVRTSGPILRLGPNAAVSLNMAFHELATNAVKYGALSNGAGEIRVDWRVDENAERPTIVIEWRESGGPPVAAPLRRGFGSRLIERGLPRELDGECRMIFAAEGLICRLRLPLSAKLSLAA